VQLSAVRERRWLQPVSLADELEVLAPLRLKGALAAVERDLVRLRRQRLYGQGSQLARILAATDALSPAWQDMLHEAYLERVRAGLITALQATRHGRGRLH
jgi:hypothetical protein